MRIYSFRYRGKFITNILLCFVCVFLIVFVLQISEQKGKTDTCVSQNDVVDFFAENGLTVKNNSVVQSEFTLDTKSNFQFDEYNKIQIQQGFDLRNYFGKNIKKYSCEIIDFPGYEGAEGVFGTLLVYNDKIIGADIYLSSVNGFMQGVIKNNERYTY